MAISQDDNPKLFIFKDLSCWVSFLDITCQVSFLQGTNCRVLFQDITCWVSFLDITCPISILDAIYCIYFKTSFVKFLLKASFTEFHFKTSLVEFYDNISGNYSQASFQYNICILKSQHILILNKKLHQHANAMNKIWYVNIPLQCTATAPSVFSDSSRKVLTIASLGTLPSMKKRSWWSNPPSVNRRAS